MEGPGRDEIIQLILCQLSEYGFSSLSQAIAAHTKVPMTADSNSRLAELVRLGLQSEAQRGVSGGGGGDADGGSGGAEADTDTDTHSVGGEGGAAGQCRVLYKSKHKGAATTAAFSSDGRYVATGAADATIKLIDVERAHGAGRQGDASTVVRTLHDHEGAVSGLAFHPNGLVLASCSADRTIRLFDLSVAQGKHAFQSFRDTQAFRSVAFHPSGEYIATGGDTPEVRLYSVRSGKMYLLPGAAQHTAMVTHVSYAANGAAVASASRDGSVKIWDGASGKCVRTIDRAHDGRPATAAVLSPDAKHVLTAGLDSCVRLWDAGSGRVVQEYVGAGMDAAGGAAAFSHDGAQVMAADAATNSVVTWDAASGQLLAKAAEHSQRIAWLAASPTTPAFVTCSDDECVRLWGPAAATSH